MSTGAQILVTALLALAMVEMLGPVVLGLGLARPRRRRRKP